MLTTNQTTPIIEDDINVHKTAKESLFGQTIATYYRTKTNFLARRLITHYFHKPNERRLFIPRYGKLLIINMQFSAHS